MPSAHAQDVRGVSLATRVVRVKVSQHAAWAMAVGGMIGGGIYTLAGVIVELAGPWAWASILIGALIALATVHSYAHLTLATCTSGVPVTILLREGSRSLARPLAWALLAVYVLSLAVYTFTAGHYFGHALGLGKIGIIVIEVVLVTALAVLNLFHIQHPARVQIAAVWAELSILALLALAGFIHWRPENLSAGVTAGSPRGVIVATASTFIAFEGFEMLAYDLRELERPAPIMRKWVPVAVLVVAMAYLVVTVGATSLVGAEQLVVHRESALAIAGRAAAGPVGLIVVTLAACASATSAINATLFSAARLARTAAKHRLLPTWCGRCNRYEVPAWSVVAIALLSVVLAATSTLDVLVAVASLGFLCLFCLVNVLAVRRSRRGRWIALAGALGSAGAAIVVVITLVR
jgi:amino acid transporter